jgi:hypothetical protein
MSNFMRTTRSKFAPQRKRWLRPGLDLMEERKLLSGLHSPTIDHAQALSIEGHRLPAAQVASIAHLVSEMSRGRLTASHRIAAHRANPAVSGVATPVPVPISLLPYEQVTVTGDVDSTGHYTDFLMTGISPDWGAWGQLKYVAITVRGIPTYFYTVRTTDRGGTAVKSIATDAPYWAPNAPTWLVQANQHYQWYYAAPPGPPPSGPRGGGGPVNIDPSTFLPAPFNHVTGNLIPGTSHYSSFQVGGNNPAKGSTILIGYVTGNPYGVNQYYWSVYIHSPILGNIGYREVDYSPYYATGLPWGVSAFVHQYLGYL